jgi:glutaredoxin
MRTLFAATAILSIACHASAQAYRWIDQEGGVHYTQIPPPPGARNVQRKTFGGGGSRAGEIANLPYATQLAAKNYPVTLRTSPECGTPCDEARAALAKRGVPFKEISVVTQGDLDELKRLSGKDQLPHLMVGNQTQSGFRDDLYDSLLDTAGYPRSGPQLPLDTLRNIAAPSEPSKTDTRQGVEADAPQGMAGYR